MKKHKISISFSKNYEDVYNFLIEKPNISQFICEIVREKMLQEQDNSLEKQVEKIVEKLLEKLLIDKEVSQLSNCFDITNSSKLNNEDNGVCQVSCRI